MIITDRQITAPTDRSFQYLRQTLEGNLARWQVTILVIEPQHNEGQGLLVSHQAAPFYVERRLEVTPVSEAGHRTQWGGLIQGACQGSSLSLSLLEIP